MHYLYQPRAIKMETHVNMKAARRMWGDYMRDNLLHMCRDMIFHHLLKNGIQFEKNKKPFDPPIEIADAFNEYWEIFVKDALDSAFCLGFVVVSILEDNTKRKYPSVVRPDLYEIHFVQSRHPIPQVLVGLDVDHD